MQCSWCDDLHLTSRQSARHLLLHHLAWEAPCPHCPGPPSGALASHSCSLPCPVCPETCGSRVLLAEHCWTAHRTLYCLLCQRTERTVVDMRAHIVEEEERLAQSCVLCGERLKGKKLMDHLLKHHLGPLINKKPAVFEERRGGHQEVQLVAVARRHRPARQQPSSGIYQFDNYSCPHCLRKFSAKSGLKIHVGIAHKGGKLLFCPRCPASFADVASCKSHFKEEHSAGRKIKQKFWKGSPRNVVWFRPMSRWRGSNRSLPQEKWNHWIAGKSKR